MQYSFELEVSLIVIPIPTFLLLERPYEMMTDKQFSLIRDYTNPLDAKRRKICGECGGFATREILFVAQGDVSVLERYCETCSRAVVKESKKNMLYL